LIGKEHHPRRNNKYEMPFAMMLQFQKFFKDHKQLEEKDKIERWFKQLHPSESTIVSKSALV